MRVNVDENIKQIDEDAKDIRERIYNIANRFETKISKEQLAKLNGISMGLEVTSHYIGSEVLRRHNEAKYTAKLLLEKLRVQERFLLDDEIYNGKSPALDRHMEVNDHMVELCESLIKQLDEQEKEHY